MFKLCSIRTNRPDIWETLGLYGGPAQGSQPSYVLGYQNPLGSFKNTPLSPTSGDATEMVCVECGLVTF